MFKSKKKAKPKPKDKAEKSNQITDLSGKADDHAESVMDQFLLSNTSENLVNHEVKD